MAPKSSLHRELIQDRIAELKSRIRMGGAISRPDLCRPCSGWVDERGLNALKLIRLSDGMPRLSLAEFKAMARDQFFMLLLYTEATLEAIPALLPADAAPRQEALDSIKKVLESSGELKGDARERLNTVRDLFGLGEAWAKRALRGESLKLVPKLEASGDEQSPVANSRKEGQA